MKEILCNSCLFQSDCKVEIWPVSECLSYVSVKGLKVGFVEIKKHKGDKECDVIIHKEQKNE